MENTFVTILYKLADGKHICVEVSLEVKSLLEQADRQIRSQRRQDRRRHAEYVDGLTDTATISPHEDFADLVNRMDSYKRLHAAIGKLSGIQRRRVHLHYFNGLTCRQIADLEGVGFSSVARALARAVEQLKTILK